MRILAFLPFLLSLASASCASGDEAPAGPVAATATTVALVTIEKGTDLEVPTPTTKVIGFADAWKADWAAWHKDIEPAPPLPAVDFSKERVVAFFAGRKPTAGYTVEACEARRRGDDIVLKVRERKPRPDAMVAQVITYPYHIVRVSAPRPPGGKIVIETELD